MGFDLTWGETKELPDGGTVRSATPTPVFWEEWHSRKDALKAAGFSVTKHEGEWQVSRWTTPDAADGRVTGRGTYQGSPPPPSRQKTVRKPRRRERRALQAHKDATDCRKPMGRARQIEIRDRKEAARKKAEAEALEMQRARQKVERARQEAELARQKAERARQKTVRKPKRRDRQRESNGPSGIPEYQEGDPRPGWCTDEDIKKGRSRYDG